jgi:NAD(P)-dependent dehydrogenase (short-subunit alcohol dehydrogenase family)
MLDSTKGVECMTASKRRVAIVTGASRGLGAVIGRVLAERGYDLIVAARTAAPLEETARALASHGTGVVAVAGDITDAAVRARLVGAARELGGLDVLVNNAGIIESALAEAELCTVDALPEAAWDAVYEVNLRAVWLATRFASPHLRRSPRGPSIVNAASVSGLTGIRGGPAYGVTKAAVIQLTKLTAVDLAPDVRCNCFCPGIIETPMARAFIDAAPDPAGRERAMTSEHLIERLGTPEEIAGLACYLASDAAAFITGAAFVADGGVLAWRGHH